MQINPVKLPELNEELKKKKKELIFELNDSNEQNKENEIIGDLFYESMKSFFDFGVELANNLTNEYSEKK